MVALTTKSPLKLSFYLGTFLILYFHLFHHGNITVHFPTGANFSVQVQLVLV